MDGHKNAFERIYRILLRFSAVGLVFGSALIIYVALQLVARLENLAPAEMRLLLDVLKNRFFQ